LVDYDGTLVPHAGTPEEATPDEELRDLLRALAARPGLRVHIVTGRPHDQIERWLGDLPLGLHAEYGFWSRAASGREWLTRQEIPGEWKIKFLPTLQQFVACTPGSFLEEKTTSLAWHYRKADPAFAALQAKELRLHLGDLAKNEPVGIVAGDKVVEIRLQSVSKGLLVGWLVAEMPEPARVVAFGDDATDEEMFAALPPGSVAIHVGPQRSRAPFRLAGPREARAFLWSLVDGKPHSQR
jgi:trehalose 6-phosphate synthase/phosphatase